jgi:hypothetical protein
MQILSLVSLLGAAALVTCQSGNGTVVTGALGDARKVTNNPVIGETWVATFNTTVKGTVTAVANTIGVNYTIDITGLPAEKGPYSMWLLSSLCNFLLFYLHQVEYHVHISPTPESGNCAETGGHLDSYKRGDSPPCVSSAPATCEVGDLSGKYGTVAGPTVKKL